MDHDAGGPNDIATILNEFFAIWRELVLINERVVKDIFEGGVDLLVGRVTALSECLYGTIEAELKETPR